MLKYNLLPHLKVYLQAGNFSPKLLRIFHIDQRRQRMLFDPVFYVFSKINAGTHWVREIVSMLLRGKAEYSSDPLHSIDFYDSSYIKKLQSPRILQSHLPFRYLPNEVKRQGRILHVSRNPKDTAVSLFCMLKKLTFMHGSFSGSFHALLQCIF
uniref:Sulfotransferase domain-containing protein n=1 Tax=Magallana gigas TaxID=29159 RepID=A0A8W8HMA0_MAGGI